MRIPSIIRVPVRYMGIDNKKSRFLDTLRIFVRAGPGGQGLPKFGGIGGKGGDVILEADDKMVLKVVKEINPTQRYVAGGGKNSTKLRLMGASGADRIVKVPVGICVKSEEGRTLADLVEKGESVVVAQGGDGGCQTNHFNGTKGEAHSVILDLKLIADIGLVGFPNAGKSTFLTTISRASPKIAEYPFTTLRPQIGVMDYGDFRQITVADLPGLIEGAHVNKGLGHAFLKHVERTKLLLFMVDINGFKLSHRYDHRSAFETILLLNQELELYNKDMLQKPAVLALNKIDTDSGGLRTEKLEQLVKGLPDSLSEVDESFHPKTLIKFDHIFKISTMFNTNTAEMKTELRKLLDMYVELKTEKLQSEIEASRLAEGKDIYQEDVPFGKEFQRKKLS